MTASEDELFAGGQVETPALAPEAFTIPLVQALGELDVPVAAGESATTAVPFVQTVMLRPGNTAAARSASCKPV